MFLLGKSGVKSSRVGNTCLNSYAQQSWSVEERVLKAIDESEIEMKPVEVAQKIHAPRKPTDAQRTTVRVVLRKLLERGLVLQPYPGAYCNKITYGVRFVPLCVHNISLRSFVCRDVGHWVKDEVVGGVKIHVCFGSERRKISGFIACDVGGMSHDACLLALNRWFDVAEGRLGFGLNDLELLTFECNKDYYGVRLDGVQCVTKKDLYGMVERVYQKEENLVRREWKVSQLMSVNKFEETLRRDLADQCRAQAGFELREEVKRVAEALKFANSRLYQLERLGEATSAAVCRLADAFGKVADLEGGQDKRKPGGDDYVS